MLKAQKQAAKRPTTIYKEVQQHERYGKNDRGPEPSGAGPYIFLKEAGLELLPRQSQPGLASPRRIRPGIVYPAKNLLKASAA